MGVRLPADQRLHLFSGVPADPTIRNAGANVYGNLPSDWMTTASNYQFYKKRYGQEYADQWMYENHRDQMGYNFLAIPVGDMTPEELNFWYSLSDTDRNNILNSGGYYADVENGLYNLFGLDGKFQVFDSTKFLDDIRQIVGVEIPEQPELFTDPLPKLSDYILDNDGNGIDDVYEYHTNALADANVLYNDTMSQIASEESAAREAALAQANLDADAEIQSLLDIAAGARDDTLASLDAESSRDRQFYTSELQRLGDAYNDTRASILASQTQRNTQTLGTMSANMDTARRNAIEAGASAGVRIAGNVNALLSAQNKMSQESLNTSNQLAQMLVSQRAAESGIRGDWRTGENSRDESRRSANNAYNSTNMSLISGRDDRVSRKRDNALAGILPGFELRRSEASNELAKRQASYDRGMALANARRQNYNDAITDYNARATDNQNAWDNWGVLNSDYERNYGLNPMSQYWYNYRKN